MSLLNRLFFDKYDDIEQNDIGIPEFMPLPNIPLQHIEENIQKGGNIIDNKMHYIQRWNLYIFIFFLSVLFAILTINSPEITRSIFKKDSISDLATEYGKDPKKRWVYMTRYTVVFICLVLCFNIVLMIGVFGWTKMTSNMGPTASFKELFWKYKDPFKKEVFIGKHYIWHMILVFVLLLIFFLGFSAWYKDWYENIYFQTVNNPKEEAQTQKYVHNYGLFMLGMMIFFVILWNLHVLDKNKVYMFYNIIFFIAYLVMTFLILKEFRFGKYIKLLYILILVFLMFAFYPILMSLLLNDMDHKDIFNSNFFKSIIFNFGLRF